MWRITLRGWRHYAPVFPDFYWKAAKRLLIFSCLRDKPLREMARILFPLFDEVIFAPIHSARADGDGGSGSSGQRVRKLPRRAPNRVREALQWAKDRAQGGVVVVSGSVYLVGEARSLLLGGESE